ncbi:MAG: hypothetical protein GY756_17680 [bacterium]|nr:hypothetical protein [bacterium]
MARSRDNDYITQLLDELNITTEKTRKFVWTILGNKKYKIREDFYSQNREDKKTIVKNVVFLRSLGFRNAKIEEFYIDGLDETFVSEWGKLIPDIKHMVELFYNLDNTKPKISLESIQNFDIRNQLVEPLITNNNPLTSCELSKKMILHNEIDKLDESENLDEMVNLANIYFNLGDIEAAKMILKRVLKKDANLYNALYVMALIFLDAAGKMSSKATRQIFSAEGEENLTTQSIMTEFADNFLYEAMDMEYRAFQYLLSAFDNWDFDEGRYGYKNFKDNENRKKVILHLVGRLYGYIRQGESNILTKNDRIINKLINEILIDRYLLVNKGDNVYHSFYFLLILNHFSHKDFAKTGKSYITDLINNNFFELLDMMKYPSGLMKNIMGLLYNSEEQKIVLDTIKGNCDQMINRNYLNSSFDIKFKDLYKLIGNRTDHQKALDLSLALAKESGDNSDLEISKEYPKFLYMCCQIVDEFIDTRVTVDSRSRI